MQRAQFQLNIHASLRLSVEIACHRNRAGARSAGKRRPAAALKRAHHERMIVYHLGEIHVGALGKHARVFDIPAQIHPFFIGWIIHIDQRVRNADEHGGISQGLTLYRQLAVDAAPFADDGDLRALQIRFAHVYGHAGDLASLHHEFWALDARQRLHAKLRFLDHLLLVDVFCKAANPVAAHLRLAAVGVEHPHSEIAGFRRQYNH